MGVALCSVTRRRWARVAALVGLVTSAACSTGTAATRSANVAPAGRRPGVVASVFPLAEVARIVGGDRVTVTDLTPDGTQPRLAPLGAAGRASLDGAAVVVDVGGGFQPAVEAAAATARHRVSALDAAGGGDPYVWLDPVAMRRVVASLASALIAADPAGATRYRRAARDFTALLLALDVSFRTSLADCARHDVVTAYDEFGRLGARYGFTPHAIAEEPPAGPVAPARLGALVRLVATKHLGKVLDDPLSPLPEARSLAAAAHVGVGTLDAIAGLTRAGAADGVDGADATRRPTYLSLMADDLAALRSALACDTSQ